MTANDFFEKPEEHSRVKAQIVAKYFNAWANVMLSEANSIRYMDLFAGKGYYDEGTPSTPILVLEKAISDERLRARLRVVLNDKNPDYVASLKDAVQHLDGIHTLAHAPLIFCHEADVEFVQSIWSRDAPPTLLFVDPWGYKGLGLDLIGSVLPSFGCDCIIFFNYNRINAHLSNPAFEQSMAELFGEIRARDLSSRIERLLPAEREVAVIEEFAQALRPLGGKYVLPFRFRSETGRKTTHYLVFVSKHPLGYQIMKRIMAKESTASEQGVPSFEYCPADRRYPLLFEYGRPLEDLRGMLLERFAGRKMKVKTIYAEHNVNTRFLEANYKEVLRSLEEEGKIVCDPPADRRQNRKGVRTLADDVWVSFPSRRDN